MVPIDVGILGVTKLRIPELNQEKQLCDSDFHNILRVGMIVEHYEH